MYIHWMPDLRVRGKKKEYDCQCSFCKDHLCYLNAECVRCTHPECERNLKEMR